MTDFIFLLTVLYYYQHSISDRITGDSNCGLALFKFVVKVAWKTNILIF